MRRHQAELGPPPPPPSPPAWLTSFVDLVCLVLSFFVLMFAMAEPREEVYEQVARGLRKQFQTTEPEPDDKTLRNVPLEREQPGLHLGYLEALLRRQVTESPNAPDVAIDRLAEGLRVAVPADLLFAPGDAVVSAEGRAALAVLTATLARLSNEIEVRGHADPTPVASDRFPSNWELSLARAAAVAAVLHEAGYRRDVTISGRADAAFARLPADLPEEQRLRLARRVDIFIQSDTGSRPGGG